MSEKTAEDVPSTAPKKGGGAVAMVLGMILPGLVAGAASFGAVKAATKNMHAPAAAEEHHAKEEKPPGPTVALDPFLVSVPDANKKMHPMKLTLAVEFNAATKEEATKSYTPRIRDAILTHMRAMTFEEAADTHSDKLRADLLEKCRTVGASTADRVLITDMVTQ
jgi:flagellar basal body-associated protein FliL